MKVENGNQAQFAVSIRNLRTREEIELPVDDERWLLSCPPGLDRERLQQVAYGHPDPLSEFEFLHAHASQD